MAKTPGRHDRLTPSLLDRLTDQGDKQHQSLAELRSSVRRDLEKLLNSRWRFVAAPDVPASLADSLVNYGLPDFTGGNLRAAQDPHAVYAAVEQAIARFELRLSNVRVRAVQKEPAVDRTLRFHIDATLEVEPWRERVRFNTVLEPASGKVTVQATESG
jgi:type VI secretion system protein ImpF